MGRTLKGLLLKGPKQMEVVEEEVRDPGKGEVLIRVDNFNLCGSDLRLYEGAYSGPKSYPIYVGHEWSGTVASVGRDVEHLKVGDHVTGDCSLWCGTCDFCARDKNLCEKIEKVGITRDGASRDYFLQDAKYVYPAGPVDLKVLSLSEPLAVVCHAASRAEMMTGSLSDRKILILGGGNMGIALLMVLRRIFHCSHVEVYDPISSRMETAVKLGAKRPAQIDFITRKDARASGGDYRDFYSDLAYDVVFEGTGSREAFSNALEIVKPLGTIVTIGFVPPGEVNLRLITLKALSLFGAIGGTGEFPKVFRALEKESPYFERLITHRFHYLDYQKAFETAMDKEKSLKVQIYF